MKPQYTARQILGIMTFGAMILLAAAHAFANRPTLVEPTGPNSGLGRVVAAFPTPAEPTGPNSGLGRAVAAFPTIVEPNGPNSGMGRTLAAFPTVVEPNGPNSGMGRDPLTGEPASGAGRNGA